MVKRHDKVFIGILLIKIATTLQVMQLNSGFISMHHHEQDYETFLS